MESGLKDDKWRWVVARIVLELWRWVERVFNQPYETASADGLPQNATSGVIELSHKSTLKETIASAGYKYCSEKLETWCYLWREISKLVFVKDRFLAMRNEYFVKFGNIMRGFFTLYDGQNRLLVNLWHNSRWNFHANFFAWRRKKWGIRRIFTENFPPMG